MDPVNLFDLAAQQSRWLAARQTAVAGNVANANTVGYKAADVEPFERVLDSKRVAMKATNAMHIGGGAASVGEDHSATTVMPSENSVVLETEMMKAGEVRRAFELNTAIVKAFHRMALMSTKG